MTALVCGRCGKSLSEEQMAFRYQDVDHIERCVCRDCVITCDKCGDQDFAEVSHVVDGEIYCEACWDVWKDHL